MERNEYFLKSVKNPFPFSMQISIRYLQVLASYPNLYGDEAPARLGLFLIDFWNVVFWIFHKGATFQTQILILGLRTEAVSDRQIFPWQHSRMIYDVTN